MKKTSLFLLLGMIFLLFLSGGISQAKVKTETKSWANDSAVFGQMRTEVQLNDSLNLLSFPGAKLVEQSAIESAQYLTDGEVGTLGGEGRVGANGTPSVLVYYLGKPRSFTEIRIFTGNIDSRGNQDFEIRLANNEANPGVKPSFPEKASLTSGDKIVGKNGGGFMTAYSNSDGGKMTPKKYDWIEFRFWQTYPSKAGDLAKSASPANSWSSLIELQIIGDPDDPDLFSSEEEKKEWLRKQEIRKFEARLDSLGEDLAFALKNPNSLKLAIEDLTAKYPEIYEEKNYLEQWEQLVDKLTDVADDPEQFLKIAEEYDIFRREVLLSNPLLEFDRLLIRKTHNPALEANWMSNASRGKGKYEDSIIAINPQKPQDGSETVLEGPNGSFVGDMSMHWGAEKFLVTALSENKTWQIFEYDMTEKKLRQVTPDMGGDVDNVEGCYVPDGSTIFISSASMMGVPCIGGSGLVGNIYRLEADGTTVRQLTYEQDQDWCPVILQNGRIMYLRWEYTDLCHYFSRYLMTMNPDGTNQVEHYGSGSYWPNSLFYAKPVPNHPSKFVGIVSGHHGVAREGEMVIFDYTKGRKEADGVVQRIPERGKEVEPEIVDQLVNQSWPKFLFPTPLDEDYYLVSCRMKPGKPWAIYLVDTFDNMLKLYEEPGWQLLEPTPVIEREEPNSRPDRIDLTKDTCTVFITDLYFGQGLPNVPVGTVKKLRLFAYSYGYRGIGGHDVFGMESGWDGKRLLGEVPVFEDGSATFEMPANTPISIQPLDENGSAIQLMRSWTVGMPGETSSCSGCHENQNSVTPGKMTEATRQKPATIEEFYGPARPFNYEGEIQPILDKFCVGCHDGSKENRPNFADTSKGPKNFSNSYHALSRFTRRPGPESDAHVLQPMEYHTSTSELVVLLEKGHHNVVLDEEAWRKLYTWIDLNVPYFGTWTEISEGGNDTGNSRIKGVSDRYMELKNMYGTNNVNHESESYYYKEETQKVAFVEPAKLPKPDRSAPAVAGWPMTAEQAIALQDKVAGSEKKQTVKVDEVSFDMVRIPSGKFVMGDEMGFLDELPRKEATIEKPFWMMTTEVTNALYKEYNPNHDSRYIDQWWKDHTTPGYPANKPEQPVIRISQQEAVEFCAWLSEKTGKKFRLPTEAEWEWACRAGSDTPMWFGDIDVDFGKKENLADYSTRLFVVQGVNPQPVKHADWQAFIPRIEEVNDGNMIAQAVGSYEANPWGLFDMHGSVEEWTSSEYTDAQQKTDGRIIAKGGSWYDRPKWARSGLRRAYEPWQRAYCIGFRVVCED